MGIFFFHPAGKLYVDDFGNCNLRSQGLFIHKMTHVWQKQTGINVILRGIYPRNYSYCLSSGKPFSKYNIEQQGDIVRDYFFLLNNTAGYPAIERYKKILPF